MKNQTNSRSGNKKNTNQRGKGKYDRRPIQSKNEAFKKRPEDECRSTDNHVEWYSHIPQLVKDSASLSFPYAAGLQFRPYEGEPGMRFPGIMVLDFVPTPGISTDATSPVNITARNLYSYIRHANSGAANGDAQDTMMYILAIDSLYIWYYTMVRTYGMLNVYSNVNRYYGQAMTQAVGFDYSDLVSKMADFRAYINTFAFRLGSLCAPKGMSYFDRHAWLSLNYFTDSDTGKGQTFIYRPRVLWQYSETTSSQGTELQPYVVFNRLGSEESLLNLEDIKTIGEELLNPILASEDCGILSGDILKAYGEANLLKVATIPGDFMIYPTFADNARAQLENACILNCYDMGDLPSTWMGEGWRIRPDIEQQGINFQPRIPVNSDLSISTLDSVLPDHYFMNLHTNNPTPEDNMVASRFMVSIAKTDVDNYASIDSCGSEVLVNGRIYTITTDSNSPGSGYVLEYSDFCTYGMCGDSLTFTALYRDVLGKLSKFRNHPMVFTGLVSEEAVVFYDLFGDVDNITMIASSAIENMNTVALVSEFGAPTMGAFLIR